MPSAAPVSIRGTGAVSAAGRGVDSLWRAVLDGAPLALPVTRYDVSALSTRRAALIPSAPRATASHRAAAYAIDAVHEATRGDLPRGAALFVGTSLGATDAWEPWHRARALGRELPPPRDTAHADTARAVADALSLRGPVVTVSTACTSSSAALIEAADAIRLGEVDDALVVGVDVLGLFVHAGFDRLGALSPDDRAPAPFGLGRRGMWLGEAAAAIHLSREGTPIARYLGGGIGSDGVHMTAPDREGRGLARAISSALRDAELTAGDIAWVSAHATSTAFNDAMESAAFAAALGGGVVVHGAKPVTGHTLGACGALEVILAIEALRRGVRPPTRATLELDPALAVTLDREPVAMSGSVALSVNSAMAGHNTAVLVGLP